MKKEEKLMILTYFIFLASVIFIFIISYDAGFDAGKFEGMRLLCEDDLIEEEGVISCGNIRSYDDVNVDFNITWS